MQVLKFVVRERQIRAVLLVGGTYNGEIRKVPQNLRAEDDSVREFAEEFADGRGLVAHGMPYTKWVFELRAR